MINLYPLAIYAAGPDHYQVLFKRSLEEVKYNFHMGGTLGRGIQKTDREFFFDTEDDPAAAFINQSILNFDEAIQEGISLGENTNGIKPVSIKFDRKAGTETYVYEVCLLHNSQERTEEISLNYESGDHLLITWKYGSAKVRPNDLGDLVFLGDDPVASKLIRAVMLFDASRYYRLDPSAKILRDC